MAHIKPIILAILTTLCINTTATATAAASEGEFVNSKSEALIKNKFTSSGGEIVLETASGATTKCTSVTDHGIMTSKTGGELTVLFKGCTSSGLSCKGGEDAAGKAKAGEIIILLGILIKRSSATTRLVLFTILKTGTKEAGEFTLECQGVAIILRGSFLTSNNFKTNELKKEWVLEFKAGAKKGEQSVTEYENEKGEKVKCKGLEANVAGAGFEPASESATATDKFEEETQFL
jgi:hypothetical protein